MPALIRNTALKMNPSYQTPFHFVVSIPLYCICYAKKQSLQNNFSHMRYTGIFIKNIVGYFKPNKKAMIFIIAFSIRFKFFPHNHMMIFFIMGMILFIHSDLRKRTPFHKDLLNDLMFISVLTARKGDVIFFSQFYHRALVNPQHLSHFIGGTALLISALKKLGL